MSRGCGSADISVTGCGHTVMAQLAAPVLSTARLPFKEMGACAASELLRQLNGGVHGEAADLRCELISGAALAEATP